MEEEKFDDIEDIFDFPDELEDVLDNNDVNSEVKPVYEEPTVEAIEPVYEEPTVETVEPVYKEPTFEAVEPVYEEPNRKEEKIISLKTNYRDINE